MSSSRPPYPALPRPPQLLRFGLRQMFLFVTLLCALCASLVLTGGPWPVMIGVGALLVAAHVFGNLIGTRLRDTSAQVLHWRATDPRLDPDIPRAYTGPAAIGNFKLPPANPLADRGPVTGRRLVYFVMAGAWIGAMVGGAAILLTIGPRIGWAGWAVGTVSCAVLGTWLAFLVSRFGTIARHAWRQARDEPR